MIISVSVPCRSRAPTLHARGRAVVVFAKRGFGSSSGPQKSKKKKKKSGKKSKSSTSSSDNLRKVGTDDAATTGLAPSAIAAPPGMSMPQDAKPPAEPEPVSTPMDEAGFEDRLASLREASELLSKEEKIKKAADSPFAATKTEDAYDKPPSLMDTITGAEEKKDKIEVFGGNRFVPVIAVLILGAALIFSTFDGGGSSKSQQGELTKEQRKLLETQRDEFEVQLKADSSDTQAIEGAAVTYANLGDYKRAEALLAQLVGIKAQDPDAWRLLAETREALGQPGKAVEAYKAALAILPEDIEILKGLSGALVKDDKASVAVYNLKEIRKQVVERTTAAAAAGAEVGGKDAAAEGVAEGQQEGLDAQSEQPRKPLSVVDVDLLLVKVYSQWKGHVGDALTVVERVIQDNPQDFRGYLSKGLLLRREGRKGDADRAFIQARFLAPKELRDVVDRIATPE